MSLINVHNEWDPIEEIIVGIPDNAQFPHYDESFHATFYGGLKKENVPTGRFSDQIIEETREDIENFVSELQKLGIRVRRPKKTDHSLPYSTPNWNTEGLFNYCPRDILLAINDTIIETPCPMRARFVEFYAYHHILSKYLQSGSRWLAAPRPKLLDSLYDVKDPDHNCLKNTEAVFDAANVLRLGRDILFLISNTGNELGCQWLQSTLGKEYKVHPCYDIYKHTHIDTTIIPLRPGLVMVNGSRVNPQNIPRILKQWEILYFDEVVDIGFYGGGPEGCASKWIAMNLLMINPELAVVDENQLPMIKLLNRQGIETLPLRLRHARTMGGGFHCVTLDVRRKGKLETYFD